MYINSIPNSLVGTNSVVMQTGVFQVSSKKKEFSKLRLKLSEVAHVKRSDLKQVVSYVVLYSGSS